MAYHFILTASDFLEGRRFAWHYTSNEKLDKQIIESALEKIKTQCGDVQFGIHKLSTESTKWKSVVKKDSFFKNMIITKSLDAFIEVISNDQELTAYDIAKFILTIESVSHLKLQKLLYYVYSEFLIQTGKKLFKDPIVAFKYGPVVESVFHKYKIHGSSIIDYKEDAKYSISTDKMVFTPSLMKILSSEHSSSAAKCIIDVVFKYMDSTANELVDKTHREDGPWDQVYIEGENCVISDKIIKEFYHLTK